MALQTKQIFVNIPVKNLEASMEFFQNVGFSFEQRFTDENAACMVLGNGMYVMLLHEAFFQTFTNKSVVDTNTGAEAILAISADSKEQVNEIVQKALDAGGRPSNEPMDGGFMYGWSFQDIDGHLWEVMYMDEDAV
ncbi:glyoxalase/bleomycin resistance/extradiol dioxygenase family protein [Marinococcus halophilus]|uniref:Extradiol dioxygenase n=1 Tax=Marinococcus halophilus TaxID=1371 RepID=A0A510Y6J0_MARHA|nr:VOC family protein [Marinococcus halophilus]OZT80629.1 glyoxalase/bleomycin resistance/extradiol dioxygenase family protein [Marinococcus halophilus]GEK58988.1 extradiol dioxygenase [Marinococcus halophilus]